MTVKADNGQWRFSHDFTVSAKAVKQNKVVHHYNWKKLFWSLIDGLAVLIILGFLIAKLKQRLNKKNQNKR